MQSRARIAVNDVSDFALTAQISGKADGFFSHNTRVKIVRARKIQHDRCAILRQTAAEAHRVERCARIAPHAMQHQDLASSEIAHDGEFGRDLIGDRVGRARAVRQGGFIGQHSGARRHGEGVADIIGGRDILRLFPVASGQRGSHEA